MPSVHDVDIIQSPLVGGIKETGTFNDLEQVISSGNVTINTSYPIREIIVVHGNLIDGLAITYNKTVDSKGVTIYHGTSSQVTKVGLEKPKIVLEKDEVIVAISGVQHTASSRVVQLNFAIHNPATGHLRIEGPFGGDNTSSTKSFYYTANGNFVAFGGYAINSNDSIAELTNGEEGGIYGLNFLDVASHAK